MAKSRLPGVLNHVWPWPAARTPGPLGIFDQADPNRCSMLGDTPGPLGLADWADDSLPMIAGRYTTAMGGMGRLSDGIAVAMAQADQHVASLTTSKQPTALGWDQIKADMLLHEALIPHLYLDSVDKVTVGVGNMLPTLDAATALAFVLRSDTSRAATNEQIKTDWDGVNAQAGKNMRAAAFSRFTLLHLPDDISWSLLRKRIDNEFLPGLKTIFDTWDNIPTPAKRALLDMAYNLGVGGLKKFKTMIEHVKKDQWDKAAAECRRSGIPDDRNQWTAARLREAAPPAKVGT